LRPKSREILIAVCPGGHNGINGVERLGSRKDEEAVSVDKLHLVASALIGWPQGHAIVTYVSQECGPWLEAELLHEWDGK